MFDFHFGKSGRRCDGVNRRNFLKIGAFGAGLTLADMLRLRATAAAHTLGLGVDRARLLERDREELLLGRREAKDLSGLIRIFSDPPHSGRDRRGNRSADGARNVVVAGERVGDEWAEDDRGSPKSTNSRYYPGAATVAGRGR